jgi:hypothetical protein
LIHLVCVCARLTITISAQDQTTTVEERNEP